MNKNQLSERNTNWKGNDVGYVSLHTWIKYRILQPSQCQHCGIPKKKLDLANRTGIYNRDLINWFWICRSCHRRYDQRPSPMRGKIRSEESNKKTSESIKKWWAEKKKNH